MGLYRNTKLILFFFIFVLFIKISYAVPTSFIEINVDDSLDKVFIREITFGSVLNNDTCLNKENKEVTCSSVLYYDAPIWSNLDLDNKEVVLNSQRFYVLTHPDTYIAYIENCTSLASGYEAGAELRIYGEDEQFKTEPVINNLTLSFSIYKDYSAPCVYLQYPYLNPHLIEKNPRWYPFDYYNMSLAYYIPNASLVNFEIQLPDTFFLSKIQTVPKAKAITSDSYSNIIFFEFKDLDVSGTEPFGASIKFERYPKALDKGFPVLMLLLLPFVITLYFLFSSNLRADNTKTATINSFYLVLLPLFYLFNDYFPNMPHVYSLAHASLFFTILILILCIIKDFTEKHEFKKENRWVWVLLSLIMSFGSFFVLITLLN